MITQIKNKITQMSEEIFNESKWYALYTKSRHEKFVEAELIKKGIEAFTPKVTFRKKWSDRTQRIEEPLFKSYCFAKFPLMNKRPILSQEGVVSVIHFNSQYIPVEEAVINSLKLLMENKIDVDPCPYFKIGERITVKKGPLKGFEGYILEKRNRNSSLVVSIDAIRTSIKCVVDIDIVELS